MGQAEVMGKLIRRSTILPAVLAPIAALSLVSPGAGSAQPLDCQNGQWWDPVAERVSTASGAGSAGLSERRLVGSGRQYVQAAASAVPAGLRGRTVLQSGYQRLSTAWSGLAGWLTSAVK